MDTIPLRDTREPKRYVEGASFGGAYRPGDLVWHAHPTNPLVVWCEDRPGSYWLRRVRDDGVVWLREERLKPYTAAQAAALADRDACD